MCASFTPMGKESSAARRAPTSWPLPTPRNRLDLGILGFISPHTHTPESSSRRGAAPRRVPAAATAARALPLGPAPLGPPLAAAELVSGGRRSPLAEGANRPGAGPKTRKSRAEGEPRPRGAGHGAGRRRCCARPPAGTAGKPKPKPRRDDALPGVGGLAGRVKGSNAVVSAVCVESAFTALFLPVFKYSGAGLWC